MDKERLLWEIDINEACWPNRGDLPQFLVEVAVEHSS